MNKQNPQHQVHLLFDKHTAEVKNLIECQCCFQVYSKYTVNREHWAAWQEKTQCTNWNLHTCAYSSELPYGAGHAPKFLWDLSCENHLYKMITAVGYWPFFTFLEGKLNTICANIYKVRGAVRIHFRRHEVHFWDFWLHTVQKKRSNSRILIDWQLQRYIQTARQSPIFVLSRLKPPFVVWTVRKQMKSSFSIFAAATCQTVQ